MENPNASKTGYWVGGIIIVILIIGGIVLWRANSAKPAATDNTPTTSTTVLPYGPVTLGIGETANFNGISITPMTLAEDSRCATGVQCVWAGTVRVAVRSDFQGLPSRQDTISLGTTTPVSTFSILLTGVTPAKTASATIANSDYRFTFEVHQSAGAADGSDLEGKG